MPFSRPALSDLRTQARADLVSRLPTLDNQLTRSLVNAVADVMAGMVFLLYGFLTWLATQLIPDTATGVYAARWRAIKGIVEVAAVPAVVNFTFVSTGAPDGTTVPAGTTLNRGDGAAYTTNAIATLASGAATVAVTASVAGAAGNCTSGTILTLATAISGIAATGLVGSTVTTGVDAETDQSAHARLILALRQPAQGGSKSDYIAWSLAVAGVTRAWVFPLDSGAGTVTVLFAVDGASYGPIPHTADITALQTALNAAAPVTAVVTAAAPTANAVNFRITNLTALPGFTTAQAQANIQASLADLFLQAGDAYATTILLESASDAITRAAGVAGFDLNTPSADITTAAKHLPVVGTITWV